MKKIMEMLQNMKAKNEKKDNKGFSLVELIIVIAIMAILVGIVGTQVLPYINKSKEAKDLQIINSYSTAAMTAYSSNAGNAAMPTTGTITFSVYGKGQASSTVTGSDGSTTGIEAILQDAIKDLTGYSTDSAFKGKMASKKGQEAVDVDITIDISKKTITTQAVKDTSGTGVLDPVKSDL